MSDCPITVIVSDSDAVAVVEVRETSSVVLTGSGGQAGDTLIVKELLSWHDPQTRIRFSADGGIEYYVQNVLVRKESPQ